MIRNFAFAAAAAFVAAAALSPSAALAGGGGGKHDGKFFFKHDRFVAAPVIVHDPCYVTKWFRTPFGFEKRVIFVCY